MSSSIPPTRDETSAPPPAFAPEQEPGLLADFVLFLRQNKKWWLIPLLLILGLLALFAALLGSPAAPFIYPLF